MNKEELTAKVFDSIEKTLTTNKIDIYSGYEPLANAIKAKTDVAEPLLGFYLSAIKYGAIAAIQALLDLEILDTSEKDC